MLKPWPRRAAAGPAPSAGARAQGCGGQGRGRYGGVTGAISRGSTPSVADGGDGVSTGGGGSTGGEGARVRGRDRPRTPVGFFGFSVGFLQNCISVSEVLRVWFFKPPNP
jgi:hypothetical protein